MRKTIIKAPVNAHYLSQIKTENGNPFELPNGILNKIIPNCGGTTLALEDNHKTIICSPRVELLKNKRAQYPNTLLIISGVSDNEIERYLSLHPLPKILITYDSINRLLKKITDLKEWRIVVDEFQCILSDSAFKSEVELNLIQTLSKCPYVTYLSATPIIDKYLAQIPEFSSLDYYEIEWQNVDKVYVQRQRHANPINAALEIVNSFKRGNYPYIDNGAGDRIYSKECVIFLNSVQSIVNIIKNAELLPEQVNIIVGNSNDNDKLISKLGSGFKRGTIPLKGQPHKLITFCTSTAYAGCDFYSTNATTFVISDGNRKNMAVDISTELIQIAGRQRLEDNPFKGIITFIYKTNIGEISEEDFWTAITNKYESSLEEVCYKNTAKGRIKEREISNMKKIQAIEKYSESYTMWSEVKQSFVINQIAYINEQYSYEVQQLNYRNGISIQNLIEDTGRFELLGNEDYYNSYTVQVKYLIQRNNFEDLMKSYIEAKSNHQLRLDYISDEIANKHPEIKYYFEQLGGERIRALGYKESKIKIDLKNRRIANRVPHELQRLLRNGERISNSMLKQTIQYVYDKLDIKKTAKATDVRCYFPNSKGGQKITDPTGKRINGWIIQLE